MEQSGFMSGLSKLSELVRRFVGTNLLWFVFNLPIVFFSLILLTTKSFAQANGVLIIIVVLAPFVFFPATSAMFGVMRNFVLGQDVRIIQSYFKYYKVNYLRSLINGIIIILFGFIIGYYYMILSNNNIGFFILIIILALLLFVFTLNLFSITVHKKTKLLESFKVAFSITIKGNILTFGLGILCVSILYISFNNVTFLVPFFVGSIIAYISFYIFNQLIHKL